MFLACGMGHTGGVGTFSMTSTNTTALYVPYLNADGSDAKVMCRTCSRMMYRFASVYIFTFVISCVTIYLHTVCLFCHVDYVRGFCPDILNIIRRAGVYRLLYVTRLQELRV